jgi:hypothetical protein
MNIRGFLRLYLSLLCITASFVSVNDQGGCHGAQGLLLIQSGRNMP